MASQAKPLGKAGAPSPAKSATHKAAKAKPTPPKLKEQRQKQVPEVEKPATDASGSGSELCSLPSRGKAAVASPSGQAVKDKAGAAKDKKPQDSLKAAKGATEDLPQTDDTVNQEQVQDAAETAQDQAPTDGVPEADNVPEASEVPEAGEAPEAPDIPENLDLSSLDGLEVGEGGKILDSDGNPIGEVVEGDPEDLVGQTVNGNGEIVDEDGDLIGRVDLIQQKTEELKDQGQEAVEQPELPEDGVPEGEEKADMPDELGEQAEPGEGGALDGDEVPDLEPELPDISTLEGLTCNKLGSIVTADGTPVGELVEGDPKKLARGGFQLDNQGQFWDNQGHVIGKAKPIEVEEEKPGLFSELGDIFVAEDSWIQDENGRKVGKLVEGDPKRLVGYAVDDDGDILDKRGNTLGRAEPWEEPEVEPEEVDFSSVEGLKPNKHGNVMGEDQVPIARVVEGDLHEVAGRGINKNGEILNDDGEVIGKVQLIPKGERESLGPFSGLGELSVKESGYIEDADGEVVGRIVEGDPKSLRGHTVDITGEIVDQYGNVNGRAERYEVPEEEEEEEDLSALEGGTVNKLGNVVDEHGTILGRIVAGNPKKLSGKKVDGNGQVWSDNGKVIGQAELIPDDEREKPEGDFFGLDGLTVGKEGMVMDPAGEVVGRLTEGDHQRLMGRAVDEDGEIIDKTGNVIGRAERYTPEEQPEPEMSPEEQEKQQKEKEDAELAKKMCTIVQQTIDTVGPICREITQRTEKASRTPKEELDEEQLVKDVKPLIEKAGNGLQECKGSLRALDPDGHIAATAKARSASHEATPAEYQLADSLKELTQTIVETIENGRQYISDMPHAKKKLNPLWALLSEPLFQIIAAVGLLLSGVLGLVGKLLDGLGLGGLLKGLLGGLGIDKLVEGLGLGSVTGALGFEGKK
ncbi:hypothetical protein BDV18DRAFT_167221 [Aspergillus unguis]